MPNTKNLTLLGWADITQLLNQVVHARPQPDTLPLYVPTESAARVRQVQKELNESLVQMPSLEPVRLADQFPEVGEMVEGSNEHITDDEITEVINGYTFAPLHIRKMVLEALALRPAAQPVGWKTEALRLFDLYAANLLNNANAQATSTRDSFRALLSVPPAAQPVGESVAISDHEKDCATCAHQTLPPYVPKCQQCNRLATGARRNWQAQPVPERVPMSREDLKAFMDESGYGHVTAQERADFINGFRSAEAHHRITTPSNQPTRTE